MSRSRSTRVQQKPGEILDVPGSTEVLFMELIVPRLAPPMLLQDEPGTPIVGIEVPIAGLGLPSIELEMGGVTVMKPPVPGPLISVAPSGILPPTMEPAVMAVLESPEAVPEPVTLNPHEGDRLIVDVLDVTPTPPPSKLDMPPVLEIPLPELPPEQDGKTMGLKPPALSSVALRGMPDAVVPNVAPEFSSVAPSGIPDVMPGPAPSGVVIPIPCAKLGPLASKLKLVISARTKPCLIENLLDHPDHLAS
jgi:hypothetical protein